MKEEQKILNTLVQIYAQLYEHRTILSCNKLFRYDVKDVEKISEFFANNKDLDSPKKTTVQKSKKAFSGVTTRDEFKQFYYENLVYDSNDEKKKQSIIRKYTKADFQEMFRILFGTETNMAKDRILSDIKYFFDSLERAKRI